MAWTAKQDVQVIGLRDLPPLPLIDRNNNDDLNAAPCHNLWSFVQGSFDYFAESRLCILQLKGCHYLLLTSQITSHFSIRNVAAEINVRLSPASVASRISRVIALRLKLICCNS